MDIESFVDNRLQEYLDPSSLASQFYRKRGRLGRGIDRIDADRFEARLSQELGVACRRANSSGFLFSPYLEMLVSKGRGKAPRIIARPTIRDKLILTALKDALHEALPDDVPRKLPNQVVRELLAALSSNAEVEIVRLDIQTFYDSIPRPKLLLRLRAKIGDGLAYRLVKAAVEGVIVPENSRRSEYRNHLTMRGVPQGLPISNFLAHLYLSHFDESVRNIHPRYFRYVDDILIVSRKDSPLNVEMDLSKRLNGIGLTVNKEKTKKFSFAEEFVFLGYEIRAGRARPRTASVEKFIRSIASLFSSLKNRRFNGRKSENWSPEESGRVFIEEVNERITGAISKGKQYGWVFYYNESTDLSVFHKIDAVIKQMTWRTEHLTNSMKSSVKKVSRSFYESKHNKSGGYISIYDEDATSQQKLKFLIRFSYLSQAEAEGMTPDRLDFIYAARVAERLSRLDRDVGFIS